MTSQLRMQREMTLTRARFLNLMRSPLRSLGSSPFRNSEKVAKFEMWKRYLKKE